jgi:hypothetical protein
MVSSIGTSSTAGLHSRPAGSEIQPDMMPMRRPGTEPALRPGLRPEREASQAREAREEKKDPQFLLHHTRVSVEERMKQVLSEKDIKMLLYMTAPLPRSAAQEATGQFLDVSG